jgi:hypothetical protein
MMRKSPAFCGAATLMMQAHTANAGMLDSLSNLSDRPPSSLILEAPNLSLPIEPSHPAQSVTLSPGVSPGVYAAVPFSMSVIVPKTADPHLIVAPANTSPSNSPSFVMPIVKPALKLEKP